MAENYTFVGVILPERAQLNLQFSVKASHLHSGRSIHVQISIVNNQLLAFVETDSEWNIFDLRNVVHSITNDHLAMIGYLLGYAYDLEITRVHNSNLGIDYVYGIDVPCLANRIQPEQLNEKLEQLRKKSVGPNGILVMRCLSDLQQSMKSANDTAFYCYRAIESLRHHCARTTAAPIGEKTQQWQLFREISGNSEEVLRDIKDAADPLRHGEVAGLGDEERARLFKLTWDVVERYLSAI